MLLNIIMVGNSQQETTTKLTSNVLRSVAGLGGGLGGAAIPIQMVTTTTHRIPQSQLGFGGSIGMASDIPLKQQL